MLSALVLKMTERGHLLDMRTTMQKKTATGQPTGTTTLMMIFVVLLMPDGASSFAAMGLQRRLPCPCASVVLPLSAAVPVAEADIAFPGAMPGAGAGAV